MTRGNTYDPADYVDNIRREYLRATAEQHHEGMIWYPSAHGISAGIAERQGVTTATAAAVIAALSPRNKWARNVEDAEVYISAARMGLPRPRACTFTVNQTAGWRIANGESWEDVLRGDKVQSFVANISGDYQRVTVDVWAMRAATCHKVDHPRTTGEYRAVEAAYQTVAAEYGLLPAMLQAIVWVVVRDEERAMGRVAALARRGRRAA